MSLEQLERCAEADGAARVALEKRLEEIEPLKSTVALLKSQLQQAQGALTAGQLALREDKEGKHDAEGKLAQVRRYKLLATDQDALSIYPINTPY